MFHARSSNTFGVTVTFDIFDESRLTVWRLASISGLILAITVLPRSPHHSIFMLACALIAALTNVIGPGYWVRAPRGLLGAWILAFASGWIVFVPNVDERRWVIAVFALAWGLVFQGRSAVFFAVLFAATGFGVFGTEILALGTIDDPSTVALELSFAISLAVFAARIARTKAMAAADSLERLLKTTETLRRTVLTQQENILALREQLLGTVSSSGEVAASGEHSIGAAASEESTTLESQSVSFESLIGELRRTFSEFQIRSQAAGRASGPIRFVFFPPTAGYDEKSLIAVDLESLRVGVVASLELALDSLPEIGGRRREGVVRLSIRHGFRVIEVAVEDNGRGISPRDPSVEGMLNQFRNAVEGWGGRFDRLARLGVGGRTAVELRILRERPKSSRYRATVRHPFPIAGDLRVEDAKRV